MSRTSHALGLLGVLPQLSPADLAKLLTRRGVPAGKSADLFDIALQLTNPTALWRHLQQCTREELEALAQPSTLSGTARARYEAELFVTDTEATPQWRPELEELWPRVEQLLITPATDENTRNSTDSLSVVEPDIPSVFGHFEHVEKVLDVLDEQSAKWVALAENRRWEALQRETGLAEADLDATLSFAATLGLIEANAGVWQASSSSVAWRMGGALAKWQQALDVFRAVTPTWWPTPLPAPATVDNIVHAVRERYPLVDAEGVSSLQHAAEWLGITRSNQPTSLARMLDSPDWVSQLASVMPDTVDSLYPDGPDTLVAAGPLSDEVERTIRQIGQWISGSLTPRFRVTIRSVLSALQEGWDPQAITDVLERSVVGGVHSVLGEQVQSTIDKAATLDIRAIGSGTLIRVGQELLASVLAADRRVESLQCERVDSLTLTSPHGVHTVHERLLEEGYPHLVRDGDGHLLSLRPGSPKADASVSPAEWSEQNAAELIEAWKVELSSPQLWLTVLDSVVAERLPVSITVEVGQNRQSLHMAPQSLVNGRLRGVDTRSDVERTIPVSHVVSVSPGRLSSREA